MHRFERLLVAHGYRTPFLPAGLADGLALKRSLRSHPWVDSPQKPGSPAPRAERLTGTRRIGC
jgi:hypothetical protein